ncbi:MAG: S1C family serine protease [Bacilli bacterium]|nr:S1C family serine protease [Bacilli bacterium]
MKQKSYYILTVIVGITLGVLGTYVYLTEYKDTNTISTTEKVVTVTETDTIKSAIEKVYDATILVETYDNGSLVSTGTGFVYKEDDNYGYILTNNHVTEDGDSVKILNNNGDSIDGTILGADEYSDIAVIRIDKEYVLQVAEIGSSSDSEIGDTVFTVGSPLGEEYMGTVTKGILSGKNRLVTVTLSSGSYMIETLQTDAAMNPGNSGGPLVNMNGQVIGINSLKLVEDEIEGMGFAIPIETVMPVIDKLEAGETIDRPYLGVQLIDATSTFQLFYNRINLSEDVTYGVVIASIEDGKPADNAGLQKGDVIIEVDGEKVEDSSKFRYILYQHNIGDSIKVKYYRGDEIKETTIVLTDKV